MSELRWDRLVTLQLVWPVSRVIPRSSQPGIPILMYHSVREGSSDPRPYFETNVSPQIFRRQMQHLRDAGFCALGLQQASERLQAGSDSEKLIVITFDDGYRDFYDTAFPILAEFQFTATVFLMTGYTNESSARFKGIECLTWNQVRELRSLGVSFGSHTVTHPWLASLGRKRVEEEVVTSKRTIEDETGATVRSFSYPYAFPETEHAFGRQLREILEDNGYENGVTTILGTANARSDRFFLPRLPVNRWDDSAFFQAKVEGGYDWLHYPQYASKWLSKIKSIVKAD